MFFFPFAVHGALPACVPKPLPRALPTARHLDHSTVPNNRLHMFISMSFLNQHRSCSCLQCVTHFPLVLVTSSCSITSAGLSQEPPGLLKSLLLFLFAVHGALPSRIPQLLFGALPTACHLVHSTHSIHAQHSSQQHGGGCDWPRGSAPEQYAGGPDHCRGMA
jgi:hypothetical protein